MFVVVAVLLVCAGVAEWPHPVSETAQQPSTATADKAHRDRVVLQ
jgi:hypothetical protein